MELKKVQELLRATVYAGADLVDEIEVKEACGSDLMSDVLAFVKEQGLLLTGLQNLQAIRTAEMMDIKAVVFVRGKMPSEEMISLADSKGVVLMTTQNAMYVACGILYSNGLVPASKI